jgi:hypothetical protein
VGAWVASPALPCPASRRRQNLRAFCLHIVQLCGTQMKVCCCAPCGGWTGGRFTLPCRRLLSADPELPACTADSCLPCLPSPLQDVPLLGQLLLAGGQQHVEERRWMMQVGSCGGGGSMGGQAGSSSCPSALTADCLCGCYSLGPPLFSLCLAWLLPSLCFACCSVQVTRS